MGWTGVQAHGRKGGAIAMLAAHSDLRVGYTWGTGPRQLTILELATGPGGVYGVLEKKDTTTGEAIRFALVVLTQRRSGEFLYKEMTEFEGPAETGMPLSLFKQLSPVADIRRMEPLTNVEHLESWRRAVRERLDAQRTRAQFQVGDRVRFTRPLTFQLGGSPVPVTEFQVIEAGRRLRLYAQANGGGFACRISQRAWQDNPWTREPANSPAI